MEYNVLYVIYYSHRVIGMKEKLEKLDDLGKTVGPFFHWIFLDKRLPEFTYYNIIHLV